MSDTVAPRPGDSRVGAGGAPGTIPERAPGTTLLGTSQGSGYVDPPALARRADGQVVQLTPLLGAVLEAIDGRRDLEAIAADVRESSDRPVSADNVGALVETLRNSGLLLLADGTAPPLRRSDPLLGLRLKAAVTDPERTRRLTAPFAALFHPVLEILTVIAFAVTAWWLLVDKGLASATHEVFSRPGLLLALLALTALSAGFHEFGHAAAARRGGATPGVMGVGLYLVWPAFYTDVTDSYRLDRRGRLRTDLGGLYFNALVVVATVAVWAAVRVDAVLLLVVAQVLQMVRQLLPLVRFDGYHVLADLTGVPDLYSRIGPVLRSLVPGRHEPAATALRPWARAVVTAWVLLVVPLMLVVLVLVVLSLPRVVGTALAAADREWGRAGSGYADGDLVAALGHGLGAALVLLPVAAVAYMLVRLVRRAVPGTWRATRDRPVRRVLACLLALCLVAGLAAAWWPREDRYLPVQPWEGGTLVDALVPPTPAAGTAVGTRGTGTVVLPAGATAPTREQPALATVLIPTTGAGTGEDGGLQEGDVAVADGDTWIFPFDEPPAPDADDNQAVAVADEDGETVYDVAFALIWADGSQPVQTDNEAYALASCEGCAAVAVAFQVVLVVGEDAPLAPTNIAASVTSECTSCLTWSVAVQLFVTLDEPLGPDAMARLEELWAEVTAYGESIGTQHLDSIQAVLTGFEQDVLAIIESDQGPLAPTATPTGSPSTSPSGTSSPTGTATTSGPTTSTSTSSPTGSPSSTPTTSPTSTPTGSASGSPSASPSTSPSATAASGSGSPSASP